jgi:hypothetical protein
MKKNVVFIFMNFLKFSFLNACCESVKKSCFFFAWTSGCYFYGLFRHIKFLKEDSKESIGQVKQTKKYYVRLWHLWILIISCWKSSPSCIIIFLFNFDQRKYSSVGDNIGIFCCIWTKELELWETCVNDGM